METPKTNPVVWFEIYVQDMDRAKKFYSEVLKVKFEELPNPTDSSMEMMSFPSDMNAMGIGGALVKMEGALSSNGSGTIVYFGCEDCAVEESRVEENGGKVCQPKMSIGEYGFCSIISDTEGNTIGFHSMK